MWGTGNGHRNDFSSTRLRGWRRPVNAWSAGGFTLLELLIALAIAGLALAVTVPAAAKFYQSMQYRAAVKEVMAVLSTARYQAVNQGQVKDVVIDTRGNSLRLGTTVSALPSALSVGVQSAAILNRADLAIIRFYPEGGSSGGQVTIALPDRFGVRVVVDWLVGGITQEKYALN